MENYVERQVKSKFEKFVRSAVKILFIAILICVFILLFGYAFMWLWNWLIPDIFGLMPITYWQAIGLLVMAKLIFGGFEGTKSGRGRSKFKSGNRPKASWMCKNEFFDWKHYDDFWKEEGEAAYRDYVAKKNENDKW